MSGRTSQDAAAMIGGQFNLVLIMALRVRELKNGHVAKVVTKAGPSVTAMEEIEQGKIGIEYLEKLRKQR